MEHKGDDIESQSLLQGDNRQRGAAGRRVRMNVVYDISRVNQTRAAMCVSSCINLPQVRDRTRRSRECLVLTRNSSGGGRGGGLSFPLVSGRAQSALP